MPPTNLPTTISDGDVGHNDHHEIIHALLNNTDAPVALAGDVTAASFAALSAITPSAAGTYGWTTDTGQLYRWNGSAWKVVSKFDIVNLRDYIVGDGVTNDAVAYQAGLDAGIARERPVYHPADLVAYMGGTELAMNSGLHWFGDGYGSVLLSDEAGTFCFAKNTGWAASTAKNHISVRGLRFRREVALAGDEGPYDGVMQFRKVASPDVRDIWIEGGMAGIRFEGCTDIGWDNIRGYRCGDGPLRFSHYAGAAGADGCRPGIARSEDSGYQLLTGTAVPTPSGPIGSAFIATQDGVSMGTLVSLNDRVQALEIGGPVDTLDVDKIDSTITIAGRGGGALLADYTSVHIGQFVARIEAEGSSELYGQGDGIAQVQRNLRIDSAVGYDNTGDSTVRTLVGLGRDIVRARVGSIAAYGMRALNVGGGGAPLVGTTDISVDDVFCYNPATSGVYIAGGPGSGAARYRFGRICVIDGRGHAADPKQNAGIVSDQAPAGTRIDSYHAEDTRSGASRKQAYAVYNSSGLLEIGDAKFVNHPTGKIAVDGSGVTVVDITGSGSPESVHAGSPGSRYRRYDGGAGTSLYIKESGHGTTGWVAK